MGKPWQKRDDGVCQILSSKKLQKKFAKAFSNITLNKHNCPNIRLDSVFQNETRRLRSRMAYRKLFFLCAAGWIGHRAEVFW